MPNKNFVVFLYVPGRIIEHDTRELVVKGSLRFLKGDAVNFKITIRFGVALLESNVALTLWRT
jgi:hypothetical protein